MPDFKPEIALVFVFDNVVKYLNVFCKTVVRVNISKRKCLGDRHLKQVLLISLQTISTYAVDCPAIKITFNL